MDLRVFIYFFDQLFAVDGVQKVQTMTHLINGPCQQQHGFNEENYSIIGLLYQLHPF